MNKRSEMIARTLTNKPFAAGMLAVMSHEGKTDGVGYEVEHVRPGRGFSATEYASKLFPNGRKVFRRTFYPGPFDAMAGYSADIVEHHSVFICWEKEREDEQMYDTPLVALPAGASSWDSTAFDGPRYWYAEFPSAELAEAYAASLCGSGEDVLPFCRDTQEVIL